MLPLELDGTQSSSSEGVSNSAEADAGDGWSPIRILVVALCFLLNMLDGADMLVMSFVAPVLAEQWDVSPERLGWLFSSSLAGMAIGCLVVAPLADRFGRKPMIVAALATVATAMLSSGFARDISELMVARLLVGTGVGTIGVTMTAMAAEYAPRSRASFAVGFVQAGWPFASIITAVVAVTVLPTHGWQVLMTGIGVLSVAMLLLVLSIMPESLSFLEHQAPPRALARINTIRPRLGLAPLAALPPRPGAEHRVAIASLFGEGRMRSSVLLWSAVTLGYFVLYFVISWIPKLAAQAGMPLADAIWAGGFYNLGAFVGTASVGWIAIRYRLNRVVASFLGAAAVAMLVFGGLAMPVWLTLAMATSVGVTVQGGFNGFWALAARLYPAEIRGTGVGWALGIGRIGAVLGPIVGGMLVGAQVPIAVIFAIFAMPLVLAAAMTLLIRID
jgi:benzoate transport